MSLLSLLSVFNEDVCATKFATRFFLTFFDEKLFHGLEINIWFQEKFDKSMWDNFLEDVTAWIEMS